MGDRRKLRHITDDFQLDDDGLRHEQSGRWDARRIAAALGITLEELARMLGVADLTIHQSPDGATIQEQLAPYANILAMVSDYYSGEQSRVSAWLRLPQTVLGGRSPLDALRTGASAHTVEQWIAGIWLGDGG